MPLKAKVISQEENQVLFECSVENAQHAFEQAKIWEERGVPVKIEIPDVHETLAEALGASEEERATYRTSLQEEMDAHEDPSSCCFTSPQVERDP